MTTRETHHTAEIYDLLRAYADQRRRTIKVGHIVRARKVWSIKEARARLERMVGEALGVWVQLDLFLAHYLPNSGATQTPQPDPKTMMASSFGATLEMTREGLLELRQDTPFGPIHMRRRERVEVVHDEPNPETLRSA